MLADLINAGWIYVAIVGVGLVLAVPAGVALRRDDRDTEREIADRHVEDGRAYRDEPYDYWSNRGRM